MKNSRSSIKLIFLRIINFVLFIIRLIVLFIVDLVLCFISLKIFVGFCFFVGIVFFINVFFFDVFVDFVVGWVEIYEKDEICSYKWRLGLLFLFKV